MLVGSDVLLGPDPPESDYLEAFRQLRASILALEHSAPFKSVLVTSANPGEGKSSMVLNLGTVLAFASRRCVCVDLDLHRPMLHDIIDVPLSPGITDVLAGEASLDEAVRETGIEGLTLFPAGSLYHQRADVLAAGAVRELLATIGEGCDFILIDSTPVLDFAVAQELARVVDLCIVVARARRSIAPVVQACEMLEDVGGTVAGLVVNDVLPDDQFGAAYAYYEQTGAPQR